MSDGTVIRTGIGEVYVICWGAIQFVTLHSNKSVQKLSFLGPLVIPTPSYPIRGTTFQIGFSLRVRPGINIAYPSPNHSMAYFVEKVRK